MHLGHLLSTTDTNKLLVEDSAKNLNSCFHSFISRFGKCNTTTKNKLIHQCCASMYGSQLWDLTSSAFTDICTNWRKAHMIALSAPYNTHCDILPLIANNRPMDMIIDCKFMNFLKTIIYSENKIVRYRVLNRLNDFRSTIRKNVIHLVAKSI